jgi:dethiobiotin synthetase
MQKQYFITGISTEVGKTVAAAIITETLQADYWKPIQAGELDNSDTHKVKRLISNSKSVFHENSYAPKTKNHLVIEGAGGLLVPLNESATILDIIKPNYKVIVVSRHYLGSINHTLLTIKLLQEKGFDLAIIFSGDAHKTTEDIIVKMTNVAVIGRINEEPYFDKNVVKEYADKFKEKL